MLKESYEHLSFPLKEKDPDSVIAEYATEFGQETLADYQGILKIFAHALRDYFDENIGERELGSLCFALASNKQHAKILDQDDELSEYIYDCVDIQWLADGDNFESYKEELKRYLEKIEKQI